MKIPLPQLPQLPFSPKELSFLKKFCISSCSIVGIFLIIIGVGASLHTSDHKKHKEAPEGEHRYRTEEFKKLSKQIIPLDVEAHRWIVTYDKNTLSEEKLVEHLLRLRSFDPNNDDISLQLGTALCNSGNSVEAEDVFRTCLEKKLPDSLQEKLLSRYGFCLYLNKKIDESIKILDQAIDKFPNSAEALCCRGEVEVGLSLGTSKPEEYFKKALSMDSLYSETWYQLARYIMSLPDTSNNSLYTARKYLLRYLELDPLSAKGHARLGMVYYYLQQPESAEKSYITALTLNPFDYNTHYNLAELYYYVYNNPQKAIPSYQRALDCNPHLSQAQFKLGLICLENAMYKEAITQFILALTTEPTNCRILLQLAVAYEKLELWSDAIATYQKILSYDQLNDIALNKLKLLTEKNSH